MKKLLLLLLISTISFAAIEESNEYDDISLEISKTTSKSITKPSSHTTHTTHTSRPTQKPTSKPTQKPTSNPIHKPTSKPTEKPGSKPTEKPGSKPTEKPGSKPSEKPKKTSKIDTTHVKHIIDKLNGKHPFEDMRNRIKELQKHMKTKKLSPKEIQRHFTGKPLNIFQKLSKVVQNGVHWIKTNGFWEPLMNVVKTVGRVAANSLCSAFLSSAICEPAVGFIFDAFIDKL